MCLCVFVHAHLCVGALTWGANLLEGETMWRTEEGRYHSSVVLYLLLDSISIVSELVAEQGAPGPRYQPVSP